MTDLTFLYTFALESRDAESSYFNNGEIVKSILHVNASKEEIKVIAVLA
jgi:hypothetical protein